MRKLNVYDGYKKINVWDEYVESASGYCKSIEITVESGDCIWHQGIICMEVDVYPKHASNYAMVCVEYVPNQSDKTNIIIEYDRESVDDTIKDMMTNKKAILGLNEEFAKNLEEFFVEYPAKRLPQGTIRIFNGAYDETGSGYVSFKSVMELIIDAFENFYNLNDDNYLKKLIEKF